MKRSLTWLVLGLASTGQQATAQQLFLTNGRIVDPAAQEVRPGNLLIIDGVIAGSPEEAPAGFAGATLDLGGRWVIPGLNDLHTHAYGNMAPGDAFDAPGTAVVAQRMLYAGVAGFLDLFGNEESLYQLRERQRAGEAGGADLFASLSCLTATKGHCTEYGTPTRVMDSPQEAQEVVADLAQKRPDVVKIVYAPTGRMPSIDKETLAAAVATATALELRTVIHVNTWNDVRDAVEVGASAVTHVPDDGPIPEDLARSMAARGVYSIPTLAVETDRADFIADRSVLDNPLAVELTTDDIIAAYRSEEVVEHAAERRERQAARTALVLASVKAMSDAGVVILSGTDSGNWGTIQGYSIHRELLKLVAAGLTPWQALAASTTKAGEFLGRDYGVGPGAEANLVILEASPIEDIRNTQRIFMVIHHGNVVDREQLLVRSDPGR
jgi:imidazolonepropionase-like amidohydrolase